MTVTRAIYSFEAGARASRASTILLGLAGLALTLTSQAVSYEPSSIIPPEPAREFRGAWVATVANLDWPSEKGLSAQAQKVELQAILDHAVHLKLNALIFQVRPGCDALYPSRIEPWSEYLTGTMGKPPEPLYDPLAFAIEEAHKRGLELHAWFNPFRARLLTAKSPAARNHITQTHPQLVHRYGDALWLDPGEREVQDYSLRVIMDVVKRYDVDGVHLDDYFYPYPLPGSIRRDSDFHDDASWRRFGARGKLSRDDWRRDNINTFIHRLSTSIRSAKPGVKLGVSPFGIWRPKYPVQIDGTDAFTALFADSRKWLANGWVDYFAPQLYWPIDPPVHSFPALLRWWTEQNPRGRIICPGMESSKVGKPESEGGWQPQEIVNQIRLTRRQPGAAGQIHWHMRSLMRNSAFADILERQVYQQPALMPPAAWLGSAKPARPVLTISQGESGSQLAMRWTPGGSERPWLWLLQTQTAGEWTTEIMPSTRTSCIWNGTPPEVVAVSAINRVGGASSPSVLKARNGAK